jgi:hypothetical protein
MFRSSWDLHQAVLWLYDLKLFELPNMDPYLVQHIHIMKVMPKLKCKNYNIKLIKILRVYKEFIFKNISK